MLPLKISGSTMGTTYNITMLVSETEERHSREALQAVIDAELLLINQQMSTYIADSELMRLNAKPEGEWVRVSEELFGVFDLSMAIAAMTGGAFDITVGPLVELWGFGASTSSDQIPDAASIASRKSRTGYQKLDLNKASFSVLKKQDIQLDLSAIAKGHGVDRVAKLLNGRGVDNYLVEIGGEIRVKGNSPRGELWRIGIESPQLMRANTQKAITVSNKGVATSGDYRNFFEVDGKRYSHTLDPRTGRPVSHQLASVTVIAKSAAKADALATAFSVLGVDKATEVANENGIAAFFVQREKDQFIESHSTAFEQYLN